MNFTINKVTLIGNLGRDPEIRFMPDGSRVASFSLATSDTWKDKTTGERKDRTEWHRIVVFNEKLAEVVEKYIRKGTKLYIEGQLQTRKWTDQTGVDKYITEVVVGSSRGDLVILDPKNTESEFADQESQEDKEDKNADDPLDDYIPF